MTALTATWKPADGVWLVTGPEREGRQLQAQIYPDSHNARVVEREGNDIVHVGQLQQIKVNVSTETLARAVGGIWPETPFESQEIRMPFADLDIFNDGVTRVTDGGGSVGHAGGTVISGMTGRYFKISCQNCVNPPQPIDMTNLGGGWLDFGMGGTDQVGNGNSTRADRTTFYHLNRIRRLALEWLPNTGYLAATGDALS